MRLFVRAAFIIIICAASCCGASSSNDDYGTSNYLDELDSGGPGIFTTLVALVAFWPIYLLCLLLLLSIQAASIADEKGRWWVLYFLFNLAFPPFGWLQALLVAPRPGSRRAAETS